MGNIFIIIVLLIMTTVGVLFGRAALKKDKTEANYQGIYAKYIADGELQKTEIEDMLANLPAALDRELSLGAMCYEAITIVGKEKFLYYYCPICTKKTGYKIQKTNPDVLNRLVSVDECNRLAKQIKGIDFKLDSSQFCKKCNPEVKDPKFICTFDLKDESGTYKTESITIDDLKILAEFSQGNVVHHGERDSETLLSDHIPHLKEILGLSKEKPLTNETKDPEKN